MMVGTDMLINIDTTGSGQFETIVGLRAMWFSFNKETVDVTSLESTGGWREMVGVKSAMISGSGVLMDAASDERLRAIFFGDEKPDFQVITPDFGTIEGPFMVSSIEYPRIRYGEETCNLSLVSAGQLTFRNTSGEVDQ